MIGKTSTQSWSDRRRIPRQVFFASVLGALVACSSLAESPLDAPGEKKITVGSEILRGFTETYNNSVEHPARLTDIVIRIEQRLDRSQAVNTDSTGFKIGVRLAEVFVIDAMLKAPEVSTSNTITEIRYCTQIAGNISRAIRGAEKDLSVTDEELIAAAGRASETKWFREMLDRHSIEDSNEPKAPHPEESPQAVPEFSPLAPPEFVRLTKDFVLTDAKGRGIRSVEAGKRLRVISREKDTVTISSYGEPFPIPANIH